MRQSRPRSKTARPNCGSQRQSIIGIALVVLPGFVTPLAAQDTAAVQQPNGQEIGIDAGMLIGLGSLSSFQLTVPAARARVGFFRSKISPWSIEPAGMLTYEVASDRRGALLYDLEVGALYHMDPTVDVLKGLKTVPYIRPFIGLDGVAGDGGSTASFRMGAGLGINVPWRDMIGFRLEANAGYGFRNSAFQLGAFAGVSVFTHHRVP